MSILLVDQTSIYAQVPGIDPPPTKDLLQTLESHPGKLTLRLPPIPVWSNMVIQQG